MKRLTKYLILVLSICLLTACGSSQVKEDAYIGNEFSGKDPWGNDVSIFVKDIDDNNNVEWTLNITIGEGEGATSFSDDFTSEMVNDEITFSANGKSEDDENVSYDYSGVLVLKGGTIELTLGEGNIIETTDIPSGIEREDEDDDKSYGYQVEDLEDDQKTVILTK